MRFTTAAVLLAALLACTAGAASAAGPRRPHGVNGRQPNIILLLTGKCGLSCLANVSVCAANTFKAIAAALLAARPAPCAVHPVLLRPLTLTANHPPVPY